MPPLRRPPLPGAPPFTRGVHPSMYRGRLWTMRQYAGFGDPAAANERFRDLLARGQTGLSVAFDLPTQMGYDADHAMARGEIGRAGVSIGAVDDHERLFAGIPLDRASVSMTINATAAVLLFPRLWVLLVGIAWVLLMALSRTYLHAHWLTDTIGGMLIGAGTALVVAGFFATVIVRERTDAVTATPSLG